MPLLVSRWGFSMRRARSTQPLTLSEDERKTLEEGVRPPGGEGARQAGRGGARILLLCGEGKTRVDVAGELNLSIPTVAKWRSPLLRTSPCPSGGYTTIWSAPLND